MSSDTRNDTKNTTAQNSTCVFYTFSYMKDGKSNYLAGITYHADDQRQNLVYRVDRSPTSPHTNIMVSYADAEGILGSYDLHDWGASNSQAIISKLTELAKKYLAPLDIKIIGKYTFWHIR